ncbi:MAG: hypothetical protein HUU50_19150 [Candidatus Brocadiae bacterium]|nr:hypothetical protein [Candidatus Brocadiia bacterium]
MKSFFAIALLIFSSIIYCQSEEDARRRKDDYFRCVDETCYIFANIGRVDGLESRQEQMRRLLEEIRDQYPSYSDWAKKELDDINSLRSNYYIRYFQELDTISQEFSDRCRKFQEDSQRKMEEIMRELEERQNRLNEDLTNISRDFSKMEDTRKNFAQVLSKMVQLGLDAKDYIYSNEFVEKFKRKAEDTQRYSGYGESCSRLQRAIRDGIEKRKNAMEYSLNDVRSRIGDLARGSDYDKFRYPYQRAMDMMDMLKKNANEVIERSKKLQEFQSRIDNDYLRDLADKISSGSLRDAKSKMGQIAREMADMYQDMDRSTVSKALDLQWIVRYGNQMSDFYQKLEYLEKIQEIFQDMLKTFNGMPSQAREDLKVYIGYIADGNLTELCRYAKTLSYKYEQVQKEIERKFEQALNLRNYINFDAREYAFSRLREVLTNTYEKWYNDLKKEFSKVYQENQDFKYAYLGINARKGEGPFWWGVEKIFEMRRKMLEDMIKSIQLQIEHGETIQDDFENGLSIIVGKLLTECQNFSIDPPEWVRYLARDIEKFNIAENEKYMKYLVQIWQNYPNELLRFNTKCEQDVARYERTAADLQDLNAAGNLIREIYESSQKQSLEFMELKRMYEAEDKAVQQLNRLDAEILKPLTESIKRKVAQIDQQTDKLMETQQREMPDPQRPGWLASFQNKRLGKAITQGLSKLFVSLTKSHQFKIAQMADCWVRGEKVTDAIEKEIELLRKEIESFEKLDVVKLSNEAGFSLDNFKELYQLNEIAKDLEQMKKIREYILDWDKVSEEAVNQIKECLDKYKDYSTKLSNYEHLNIQEFIQFRDQFEALEKKAKEIAYIENNSKVKSFLEKWDNLSNTLTNPELTRAMRGMRSMIQYFLDQSKKSMDHVIRWWDQDDSGKKLKKMMEESNDRDGKFFLEIEQWQQKLDRLCDFQGLRDEINKTRQDAWILLVEWVEKPGNVEQAKEILDYYNKALENLLNTQQKALETYINTGEKSYKYLCTEMEKLDYQYKNFLVKCQNRQKYSFYREAGEKIKASWQKAQESLKNHNKFLEETILNNNWFKGCKYEYNELVAKRDCINNFRDIQEALNKLDWVTGLKAVKLTSKIVSPLKVAIAGIKTLQSNVEYWLRKRESISARWNLDANIINKFDAWRSTVEIAGSALIHIKDTIGGALGVAEELRVYLGAVESITTDIKGRIKDNAYSAGKTGWKSVVESSMSEGEKRLRRFWCHPQGMDAASIQDMERIFTQEMIERQCTRHWDEAVAPALLSFISQMQNVPDDNRLEQLREAKSILIAMATDCPTQFKDIVKGTLSSNLSAVRSRLSELRQVVDELEQKFK